MHQNRLSVQLMAPVHPAIVTRTERYFREYTRLAEKGRSEKNVEEFSNIVATDLALRGKIKPDRANIILSGIFKDFAKCCPAYNIVREDKVERNSLKTSFDPLIGIVTGLEPGRMHTNTQRVVDAFQVVVVSSQISKRKIEIIDCNTGVQINFHAIARLDEREIEGDPIYGLARNLKNILVFATLYQYICTSETGMNFVIPYDKHLLMGQRGSVSFNTHHKLYSVFTPTKAPYPREVGNPRRVNCMEIKTAVSFNELTREQDQLRDALVAFAFENIDYINMIFESLYCSAFSNLTFAQVEIARIKLAEKFKPIAAMPAWIKSQQR
jgi:hypothetical protein